jgi:tRNA (guanine-N7-)-methyltransferase
MKPKDLAYPFRFEDRRLIVENGVFYLPDFLSTYADFDPGLPLGGKNVFVEFCSGNGEWIIQKALSMPDVQFIAVEKNFSRVQKIHSKKINLNIQNLFIVSGDIHLLINYFIPKKSVDTICVNFPDPWPKERHAKNRLFQKKFIDQVGEIIKDGGELILVTDDKDFSSFVATGMEHSVFSLCKQDLTLPIENYGSSFFQRLWEAKGKQILYHHYKKGIYA